MSKKKNWQFAVIEPLVRHAFQVKSHAPLKELRVLGTNLNKLRQQTGLSQDKLAVKADLTKRYIQMIEAGQKCPTLHTLKRIKTALDCDYGDLLDSF